MGKKVIPECVMALIDADFLTRKPPQISDRKYFCVDCSSHALTEWEKQNEHENHHILKPFSCSKYYAYEFKDIKGLNIVDVSNVALFSVNSKLVIFPKSRLLEYCSGGDGGGFCLYCGWKLGDKPGLYCSILCKLLNEWWVPPEGGAGGLGFKVGGSIMDQNRVVVAKATDDDDGRRKAVTKGRFIIRVPVNGGSLKAKTAGNKGLIATAVNGDGSIGGGGGDNQRVIRRHRRKGIPYRAPFF